MPRLRMMTPANNILINSRCSQMEYLFLIFYIKLQIHYSYARDDDKRAEMKKTSAEFLKKYYEWRVKYGSLRKQLFLAKKTYQLDEVERLAAAAYEEV